jgi:hypothetical protein
VVSAEAAELAGDSLELVTAAQAAHWFEFQRFCDVVRRALVPGGLLALWCYSLLEVEPAFDALVRELHDVTLALDWPLPRRLVDEGYRSLTLPFPEEVLPPFAIERRLPLREVLGYVDTWSGLRAHRRRTGADPLQALRGELERAWGDPLEARLVRWPLHTRVARKPAT